jgi:hypothetical protein
MTNDSFRHPVVRQRNGAVLALLHVTTLATLDKRRIPSPIEEQDDLLALLQSIIDRSYKLFREHACPTPWARRRPLRRVLSFAQIEHFDPRKTPAANPFWQVQVVELP